MLIIFRCQICFNLYILAGLSFAQTFLQVMEEVPSDIIINKGITLLINDPSTMISLSAKSNQELIDMEGDLCTTKQIDVF